MNCYVMTLFPEMVEQGMRTSILGKAMEKGLLTLEAVNIRDYTKDRHKKTDDYPYGGGAGMLMQAQPVFDCYRAIAERIEEGRAAGGGAEKAAEGFPHASETGSPACKARVIYLTPQGRLFSQKMARELSKEENLIFLCGHYEGIDERVLEEIVTDYVSVGDYVLTGGELPAMVMVDAIARLVPGVLHNETSADFETFHNDLLEYPQYSRPEEWHGKRVPEVLLSGDHRKIAAWRLGQSERRTAANRPDMYGRYRRKQQYIQLLREKGKAHHIDMTESLRRGRGEIAEASAAGILIRDEEAKIYMLAAFDEGKAEEVAGWVPGDSSGWQFAVHQECLLAPLEQRFPVSVRLPVYHAVYTERTALSVPRHISFRKLGEDYLEEVMSRYHMPTDKGYLEERLRGGHIYGAFADGRLAGFAGTHQEGSIGLLEVYGEYRRQGIGRALEAFMVNLHLSMGYMPYGAVAEGNQASLGLQGSLKMCMSKKLLYWVW